jgi:hypothetical protein
VNAFGGGKPHSTVGQYLDLASGDPFRWQNSDGKWVTGQITRAPDHASHDLIN